MDIVGDTLWGGGKFHSIDCGAVVVKTTSLPSPIRLHTYTMSLGHNPGKQRCVLSLGQTRALLHECTLFTACKHQQSN